MHRLPRLDGGVSFNHDMVKIRVGGSFNIAGGKIPCCLRSMLHHVLEGIKLSTPSILYKSLVVGHWVIIVISRQVASPAHFV